MKLEKKLASRCFVASRCFSLNCQPLYVHVAINLGVTGKMSIIYGDGQKTLRADFTLLFVQNEDVLHTKQHTQEQYVSDLSIDIILKTKKRKIHYYNFKNV